MYFIHNIDIYTTKTCIYHIYSLFNIEHMYVYTTCSKYIYECRQNTKANQALWWTGLLAGENKCIRDVNNII